MKKWIVAIALLSVCGFSAYNHQMPLVNVKELDCLARNIYYEARGESVEGQVAVAKVTLNRAKYSSICAVVYKKNQFSWTKNPYAILDRKAWYKANIIAYSVYISKTTIKFEATHYHTKEVRPKWREKLQIIATIGNHIFYK